jgi:hypothetical protein
MINLASFMLLSPIYPSAPAEIPAKDATAAGHWVCLYIWSCDSSRRSKPTRSNSPPIS